MAAMDNAGSAAAILMGGSVGLDAQNSGAEQTTTTSRCMWSQPMSTIDVLLELMEVAALLVTVALTMTACRQTRLACLGSLSIRLTLVLLVLSVLRDDWMIGARGRDQPDHR